MPAPTLSFQIAAAPVILFGLECPTTRVVLERLRAEGVDIRLLCLPGPPGTTILRSPAAVRQFGPPLAAPSGGSVAAAAQSRRIEVWRVGDLRSSETAKAIAAVDADLLIVACFNRLIPSALYVRRRFGGINIHPSLLPDKRGPDPLFWTFKREDRVTGSTIHRLTSRFDAGDILAQKRIDVPDGITEAALDACLARIGGDLAVATVTSIVEGTVDARPQDEAGATWARRPAPNDYRIDPSGTARAAFNFVRGVAGRGYPMLVRVDGREIGITEAVAWAETAAGLPTPAGDEAIIPFASGVLLTRIDRASM